MIPCHGRQLRPRRDGHGLHRLAKQGGFGKSTTTAICRRSTRSSGPNRDTLYSRGVRPRCRAGNDHAARRGRAHHDDDGDRPGSLCLTVAYGGPPHPHRRRSARAMASRRSGSWSIQRIQKIGAGTRLQDAVKVEQPGGPGKFESAQLGSGRPKKGARCAVVLSETLPDLRSRRRTPRRGRSGQAPDRDGDGLGPQSRQGCDLPQRHADAERRQTVYRLTVTACPSTASGRSASMREGSTS